MSADRPPSPGSRFTVAMYQSPETETWMPRGGRWVETVVSHPKGETVYMSQNDIYLSTNINFRDIMEM